MRKKAGIVLCIMGAALMVIAVVMLFNPHIYQDEQANNNENITEAITEIKDGERSDTTTENQKEAKQETSQEQVTSNTDSKKQSSTEQSAHDINSEVYEWPCGNKRYQGWAEPRQVTEFAEYKEYYEQISQQFLEYEGKDVEFSADENGLYFDQCLNEGSVKVSYDKKKLMDLLEKSKVKSVYVSNDYIIFDNTFDDNNYIMYFYDETLTYDDPLPSEKDDLMSHYSMVNIAPHWWWKNLETKGY